MPRLLWRLLDGAPAGGARSHRADEEVQGNRQVIRKGIFTIPGSICGKRQITGEGRRCAMRGPRAMTNFSLPALAFATALISFAGPAFASNDVTIYTDQAKILQLTGKPGTIVVGNPSIADVTVQGDRVVLMGRSYGVTNIIILDQ